MSEILKRDFTQTMKMYYLKIDSTSMDEDSKTKNEKKTSNMLSNRDLISYDQIPDISSAVEDDDNEAKK